MGELGIWSSSKAADTATKRCKYGNMQHWSPSNAFANHWRPQRLALVLASALASCFAPVAGFAPVPFGVDLSGSQAKRPTGAWSGRETLHRRGCRLPRCHPAFALLLGFGDGGPSLCGTGLGSACVLVGVLRISW